MHAPPPLLAPLAVYELALGRGNEHFLHRDYLRAIEAYTQAIRLFPARPLAYLLRAAAYDRNREPARAEADRRAAELLPFKRGMSTVLPGTPRRTDSRSAAAGTAAPAATTLSEDPGSGGTWRGPQSGHRDRTNGHKERADAN
jgi:hypothetical protein